MWWLLTSNASVPLAAEPVGDGRSRHTNTQGFSYWLDGMPVHSTCCLIVLIVFVSPPKANTKNVPCMIVWISDQWRGTRFAADGCACRIQGFTCAHNDPWTVPITVSSHDIYDIASLHKDNPFQSRCRWGAALCFALLCVLSRVHTPSTFIWWFYINLFFPHPGQWRSRNTERLEHRELSLQKPQAAGWVRVLRLITLLLEGSARSCLNRPRPAGD